MFLCKFILYKSEKLNMENKSSKTKIPGVKHDKSLNSSLLTFDLPSLIDNMKQKESWAKGELNAMILLKRPDKQIVLATLHKGTEIKSFQSSDLTTFHIIEGKLKFHKSKESETLDKGHLLTLQEKTKYRLTTKVETVFLLTTTNGTFIPAEI